MNGDFFKISYKRNNHAEKQYSNNAIIIAKIFFNIISHSDFVQQWLKILLSMNKLKIGRKYYIFKRMGKKIVRNENPHCWNSFVMLVSCE